MMVLGLQFSTVVSGFTNRTDVSYEIIAGAVWRVTDSLSGVTRCTTRERLTGLSDALLRHTVAIGANGVTNEVTVTWDEQTRMFMETFAASDPRHVVRPR